MSRTCLCVLCGLPAAGKSRLADVLRGRARSRGWETLLVTYDELIPARDWREDEWKQQRKTVLTCLERFLHQTHTRTDLTHTHTDLTHTHTDLTHTRTDLTHTRTDLTHTRTDLTHTRTDLTHTRTDLTHTRTDLTHTRTDLTHTHTDLTHTHTDNDMWMQLQRSRCHTNTQPLLVLLDDNFYYQSMRYQIYQLARKYSMGFCQVLVRCPLDICLQRNQRRSLRVPDEVMLQMSERMEPPNESRNSWEQQSLTVDSTDSVTEEDVQKLMDLLQSAMENPLRPFQDDCQQKEADRQICATNVLHRADQMCRRLISQAMTSARDQASSDVLKDLAKELNELKTHFLQELKKEMFHQMSLCPEEPMNTEKLLMTAARTFERDAQHCVLKQRFS
ncbi:L-seryl-tRNA(Sec) kinase isoform X2 [Triplophysa rosa]|uniref:L-seryl-tRNA(Sec) kinase isoform X2 n=1 Tax=Triplophysa rosa TaxID=992332 RepID=UPI002545E87A|nr:L-seryl-tRNA(Sec) kinase isoform X2 [Triplophysa rosa]